MSGKGLKTLIWFGLLLYGGFFIGAQERFLMEADFHLYDEARGVPIVSLGESVQVVTRMLGSPVSEDPLPDLRHSAVLFYDGLRITYHPGLESVVVLTIQGGEFTTYRGLRVGDGWRDAEEMYPPEMFRHDGGFIYGSMLVPRVPIDDDYFIRITKSEDDTVGSITMGFAVP